jgi:UDP-glucose 4-epimerase
MLSQAVRRTGRPWVAVPRVLFATAGRSVSTAGLADFSPEAVRYLTYGRGLDTTAMRRQLGFEPALTSQQAFASFADRRDPEQEVDVA